MQDHVNIVFDAEQTKQLRAATDRFHIPVGVLVRLTLEVQLAYPMNEEEAFKLFIEKCNAYHIQKKDDDEMNAILDQWKEELS